MRAEKNGGFTVDGKGTKLPAAIAHEEARSKVNAGGKAGGFRRTMLAVALLSAFGANVAMAQSITGGLYGSEPTAAGSTVVVTNSATGYRKVVQVDKSGYYKLDGLNPGLYTVTIQRDGNTVGSRKVPVTTNTNVPVATIAAATGAAGNISELGTVQVNAAAAMLDIAPIDVSTPTYLNHYDMKIVNDLPTGRGMESIALLRSSAVYDDQATHLVVLGGASPAENRYFYNGFDTTNDFTGIGANRLPAEALQGTDVIQSAGGASWTNVTGGLMAATVRQGTNEFQGGYSLYLTPATSSLEPASPNSNYIDGNGNRQYFSYASDNRHNAEATQYVWASGPLIKDKLFLFAMVGNAPNWQSTSYSINRRNDTTNRDKNGLFNLTWNISADQSLDVVGSKDVSTSFTNQYALTENYTPSSAGAYKGWSSGNTTNKFLIGNYNWHINDTMSLVLMGGYLSQDSISPTSSSGTGLPYVTEVNPVTQQDVNIGISNTANQLFPTNYSKRGFNAKFNWQLGDHKITLGAEHYSVNIFSATETTQGGDWTYYTAPGTILPNGTAVPGNGQYVSQYFLQNGGNFNTINKGAYLEDYWQAADRWVVYLGSRFDVYTNKNVNGANFMRMPLLTPRLGVAWDVNGDSSTKLGANLGKYGLSVPTSVNAGAAGATYAWWRWYTYTGRDPVTQAPTGLSQLGPQQIAINGLA
ncbi:MAG TPA: TonB-dependent receptor, partial [Rhodanobacter sp.]|nr:TonB-dependent receptor [Rhodanobacter sp.]